MANLFQYPDNFISTVFKLYQRTEASLNEDIQQLKTWMKTQTHLPEILDDKSLQNFLILNKCSIEKTKESVDMYYTLRSRITDVYENSNPKCCNMKKSIEIVYFVPGPVLTKDMYRVIFFKLRQKENIDKLHPVDAITLSINLQEVRLMEDVMFGDVVVYDMEGLNFGYVTKLTPAVLAKIYTIYSKIFSIPMKKVYIINSHPYISTVLMILKSMIKPKIFERIKVCEDASLLEEYLPKEIIPKDYGGDGKSLEELQEIYKVTLARYQKRFDDLDKLRVNESLRPQKLENDEVLGFYGNFKKLSVD